MPPYGQWYYDIANNYEKLWLDVRQLDVMFQALVVTLCPTLNKFFFLSKEQHCTMTLLKL